MGLMKNISFAKLMVIVFVVGFCVPVSGMEIVVTLSVSKKLRAGHKAVLSKSIGSKEKATKAVSLLPYEIDREKEKVLFKDVFKKKYKYLVTIDKAMYRQGDLEKDWLETVPSKVLLKFVLKNIEYGKNDVNWKNALTLPHYLPYALVKSLMQKPYVHKYDGFEVIFTLDEDSQARFKQEAQLKQKPEEKKDRSWRAKIRLAFVPLAVLTAVGIGVWAYKNQPNRLSDFLSAGYAKIISPITQYLNKIVKK